MGASEVTAVLGWLGLVVACVWLLFARRAQPFLMEEGGPSFVVKSAD